MENFHRGQIYQFLVDKWPVVVYYGQCRYCNAKKYVSDLPDVYKAYQEYITSKLPVYNNVDLFWYDNPKIKCYRFRKERVTLYEGDKFKNDFYEGRCYQFLKDCGDHINEDQELIKTAHKRYYKIHTKKWFRQGTEYPLNYSICYCEKWYYGDYRCSCDNAKVSLCYDNVDKKKITLDDCCSLPIPYTIPG